jgi:hypothetical protein
MYDLHITCKVNMAQGWSNIIILLHKSVILYLYRHLMTGKCEEGNVEARDHYQGEDVYSGHVNRWGGKVTGNLCCFPLPLSPGEFYEKPLF